MSTRSPERRLRSHHPCLLQLRHVYCFLVFLCWSEVFCSGTHYACLFCSANNSLCLADLILALTDPLGGPGVTVKCPTISVPFSTVLWCHNSMHQHQKQGQLHRPSQAHENYMSREISDELSRELEGGRERCKDRVKSS